MKPTVSIVTIFLNAADFLEEAVESVFAQRYRSWELLLVDDGSTDGSTEIAERFAAKDPDRVRYLEHPNHENRGMSASRNLGLEHARGELIAYLDADDWWFPDKLSHQVETAERHDVHVVYGPGILWHSWSGRADAPEDHVQELGVDLDRAHRPPSLLPVYLRRIECTPGTSGSLIRKASLVAVGASEISFRGMYEDQVVFCKLASKYPVWASSTPGYRYRQHAASACAVALGDGSHLDERRAFLIWIDRFLRENDVDDPAIASAWRYEWDRFFGWKAAVKEHVRPYVPHAVREWIKSFV